MAIFRLDDTCTFPNPELAEKNGLLAIGGDLSVRRLVVAYTKGIFPWYSKGDPLLWWFTDPRLVLFPDEFHISKSLARTVRRGIFSTSVNRDFAAVIKGCATTRTAQQEGTWISEEMQGAYLNLHIAGYAHSVECWFGDELAGGLYGVQIGKIFFGESMFSRKSDASKVAFITLIEQLKRQDIQLIDCQMTTKHLVSLGAREIEGRAFRQLLQKHIQQSDYEDL